MRNLTHKWPILGHIFPILGHLFPIFEKGQGRPHPNPLSLSSYAPVLIFAFWSKMSYTDEYLYRDWLVYKESWWLHKFPFGIDLSIFSSL